MERLFPMWPLQQRAVTCTVTEKPIFETEDFRTSLLFLDKEP